MRGKKILEVIIDQLLQSEFRHANRLLLSGTSAGSLAVMMNADFIRNRIPKSIDVRALADSGYFVDVAAFSGDNIINRHFQKMFDVHNSVGGVDEDCERGLRPSLGWKCLFPQHAFNYVDTPLFVLQSAYDEWQLIHIRGINCQVPEWYPVVSPTSRFANVLGRFANVLSRFANVLRVNSPTSVIQY